MPVHGPDDVRLNLSFPTDSTLTGALGASLAVVHADTHEAILQLDLSPVELTRLMAGLNVTATSSMPVPRGPGPDCQETEQTHHGDCDGRVREYLVVKDNVVGQLRGEAVLLCRGHAQFHGPKIRRPGTVAEVPQ